MTNKVVKNDAINSSFQPNPTSHNIRLVRLCKEHLDRLAENIREEDCQELWASYRQSPRNGLEICARNSLTAVAFLYRGKVAAVAGLVPTAWLGCEACVWSMTGREVLKCPKAFWKISKQVLKQFRRLYPHLYCVCDVRYAVAQRYLERLGARPVGSHFFLAGQETKFQGYQWQ